MSIVIDKVGNVNNILVTETSGSTDITKSAVKAVKKWKYKPAMENGKPAAHSTYEKLIKLPSGKLFLELLTKAMTQVDGLITVDKNIILDATIKKYFWSADLVRNEFLLTGVEDLLHTLYI